MKRDTRYDQPRQPVSALEFDRALAPVFDDIIHNALVPGGILLLAEKTMRGQCGFRSSRRGRLFQQRQKALGLQNAGTERQLGHISQTSSNIAECFARQPTDRRRADQGVDGRNLSDKFEVGQVAHIFVHDHQVVDEYVGYLTNFEFIRQITAIDAQICTAAVSRLPRETFRDIAAGLGDVTQLPPGAGVLEAERLLALLETSPPP